MFLCWGMSSISKFIFTLLGLGLVMVVILDDMVIQIEHASVNSYVTNGNFELFNS